MYKQLKVKILRQTAKNTKPEFKEYTVENTGAMTILDVVNEVKWKQDGTLTYRRSCRSGICGSCAMNVNGINMLACETQVVELKTDKITIKPLPGLTVIKDLVVDMDPFYEKLHAVRPYLINDNPPPTDKERYQSPEDRVLLEDPTACILCASCSSSCPSFWTDPDYLGPAALLKAYRFEFDTRDEGSHVRLPIINNKHGLYRCHTIMNCNDACPKNLYPTEGISRLKKKVISEIF